MEEPDGGTRAGARIERRARSQRRRQHAGSAARLVHVRRRHGAGRAQGPGAQGEEEMKALARISLVRWLAAVGIAWLIVSCGGGVGTGGTGSFASGPISGFGSIVVDGVDF